ncbi:diaminopimelate decarboxylase [Hypericibacter terrae]|uniref:Diaminopimelate decarboxylase n=1 Tax=Hypericibacter terrae TaxID=2602015 RepID=A0A5J6MTI1_9PROT|nr:diaminopimelate decarboxylase [Hypericibacter terrae]QEX19330.1 diaminopimelate decarboxylase [Hypericibacter terrae]
MSVFAYRQGELHAEALPLSRLAAEVGTPFFCYSHAALASAYDEFSAAVAGLPSMICYALKANSNLAVIATFAQRGAGADVVSEGELRQALAAGVPAQKIIFSGVGKTAAEMKFALETGIRQINVESLPELRLLDQVARGLGRKAIVALRINPDVDARTHAKISTGKAENKFGIELGHVQAAYQEASGLAGIDVRGLALHIGSQLTDLEPYRAAFRRVAEITAELRGVGLTVDRLDLGGGIGIAYRGETPPAIADYVRVVRETVGSLKTELAFEPGRWLVGNAGILVSRVLFVKPGASRDFVIIDAAMNDLIRPALYDAYHAILPVKEAASDAPVKRFDVVGPICESGDRFAEQRPLPPLQDGDLVAICQAGAYSAVMASGYNSRLAAPEILVHGHAFDIVRARPDYQSLLARDQIPDWLGAGSGRPGQAKGARGAAE